MHDFSAHLLQIPVMLVTVPKPLSNCQAQSFVFLITPEKASLPMVGTPGLIASGGRGVREPCPYSCMPQAASCSWRTGGQWRG